MEWDSTFSGYEERMSITEMEIIVLIWLKNWKEESFNYYIAELLFSFS